MTMMLVIGYHGSKDCDRDSSLLLSPRVDNTLDIYSFNVELYVECITYPFLLLNLCNIQHVV